MRLELCRVVCLILPALNGLLNGFLWPAYTLYFQEQWLACGAGWSCTRSWLLLSGVDSTDAIGGWLLADSAACCYPLDICSSGPSSTSTRSGLCLHEILVVFTIDPTCAIEGLAFDTFGNSESPGKTGSINRRCLSTPSAKRPRPAL